MKCLASDTLQAIAHAGLCQQDPQLYEQKEDLSEDIRVVSMCCALTQAYPQEMFTELEIQLVTRVYSTAMENISNEVQ